MTHTLRDLVMHVGEPVTWHTDNVCFIYSGGDLDFKVVLEDTTFTIKWADKNAQGGDNPVNAPVKTEGTLEIWPVSEANIGGPTTEGANVRVVSYVSERPATKEEIAGIEKRRRDLSGVTTPTEFYWTIALVAAGVGLIVLHVVGRRRGWW